MKYMSYQFFILFGLTALGWGVGAWYVAGLRRSVRLLYGSGEIGNGNSQAELIRRLVRLEAGMSNVQPRLDRMETVAGRCIQKVGFVRFNPFQDTGGDNSFILVLLDAENTGVMISSLFGREGVRVYGKAVEQGRTKYQLSEEEKAALAQTVAKTAV